MSNRNIYLQLVENRSDLVARFANVRRIDPQGGSGVFSLVFLAEDSVTGQAVALKFYNPDRRNPADAYRWECFDREARVLAHLRGQADIVQLVADRAEFVESIPTSVGLSLDITFAYFGMERAETDVATKVANHTWTIDQTLRAFHDICRAVQRIHLRQLVHRDLKPSNFLVMPSGKIKLSDFGTARFLDGSEPPLLINYDRIPGDMRYAAPEIFAGLHDVDPRYAFKADVFSLGTILFEMLTGVNLGVHVFGPPLLTAFANHMMVVPRADRPSVYEQIVANISAANPLPSITAFAPLIPASIRSIVDQLYRGMCNFDYRARNCDFNSIFRHIDACVLILNNEVKYRRWQEEKRKRRLARLAKGKGVTT